MKKPIFIATAILATALALGGCSGKDLEPFNDAPVVGADNTGPAQKLNMPDGYSNVATKCDHGNRIYVAFHGDAAYAAIAIVPQDPTCK
jgi:hypothetical protein